MQLNAGMFWQQAVATRSKRFILDKVNVRFKFNKPPDGQRAEPKVESGHWILDYDHFVENQENQFHALSSFVAIRHAIILSVSLTNYIA
jgi:hypothetical protein